MTLASHTPTFKKWGSIVVFVGSKNDGGFAAHFAAAVWLKAR
jgi:hypothetical protein